MSREPNNVTQLTKLITFAKQPSTIVIGVGAIALVAIGYTGVRFYLQQNLPKIIEQQLSNILQKPVKVGEVQNLSFALNQLEIPSIEIGPTATDQDKVKIENIKVNYNILPLLLFRPLPATINLGKINAYLEQDQAGNWIELNLPKQQESKLPIGLDISLGVPDVEITLQPYAIPNSIKIGAMGTARYTKTDQTSLQADLDSTVAGAKVRVKGNGTLETGTTNLQLIVEDLSLPGLSPLIPKTPVVISEGKVNGDVNLRLPSFEKIEDTTGQGKFNLDNLQATIKPLKKPLFLDARLQLQGQKVLVENGQASLGDLVAKLTGEVDWRTGYNLSVNINPFSLGNLIEAFPQPLPIPVEGKIQSTLKVSGPVLEPQIKGTLNNVQPLQIDKVKFNQISANFDGNLNQIAVRDLIIRPTVGGQIKAEALVTTNLQATLKNKQPINWVAMPLSVTFASQLPTQSLVKPYYSFPSQITVGNLFADGKISGTLDNPNGKIKWGLQPTVAGKNNNITGSGELDAQNKVITLTNTRISALGGNINVNGQANLENKQYTAFLNADALPLNPFIAQISQIKGKVNVDKPINLKSANFAFSGRLDQLNLAKISGNGDIALNLDGGRVNLNTQLNQGNVILKGNAAEVAISQYVPVLPVAVTLSQGQLNGKASLEQLLSFSQKQDLSSVTLSAQGDVFVSGGNATASLSLNNNQWQSNINASNINTSFLASKYYPSLSQLPNLNAQVNLNGNISPLFKPDTPLNIQVSNAQVNLGKQSLNAKGSLSLANLTTKPDITRVDLAIATQADLKTLPINQVVDGLPLEKKQRDLLPQDLKLLGVADFQGSFVGRNLLSQPLQPGNLSLKGNLVLSNLSVSDRPFEPRLSGPVNITPGQEISVNLKGQQDAIALGLEACVDKSCRLPYLPKFLDFHQGKPGDEIAATGTRQGDRFIATVKRFPLEILNIAPAQSFGIPGIVRGEVQADVDVNLFTSATQGNIRLIRPGIGNANLDEVDTNIAYRVQDNQIQVADTVIKFGRTQYNVAAEYNLATGAINGNLDIPSAYVQDIFKALKVNNIEDVTKLFKNYKYANALAVGNLTVGNNENTIEEKLNILWQIDKQITQFAQKIIAGGGAIELDIEGAYTGGIKIAGNLKNPEVDLKFKAEDWQWRVKPSVLNILAPLGLVHFETQVIPIPEILVDGNYSNGNLSLTPVRLAVGNMVASVSGSGINQNNLANLKFSVENLSVDLIRSIAQLPIDLSGNINLEGSLGGSINKPEIKGQIAFVNAGFNGLGIGQDFKGDFTYTDARLQFTSSEPTYIDLKASVPFPLKPQVNDQVNLSLKVTKEALSLVKIFTQNQLNWKEGDFNIDLQAKATIDLNLPKKVSSIEAKGIVNFNNTVFEGVNIAESATFNGTVNLENQKIIIPDLRANVDQAQAVITGVIPLLKPLSSEDSDSGNPLKIQIKQGQIDVARLYQGNIDGDITVNNMVLQPVISGQVALSNGQIFLPEATQNNLNTGSNTWVRTAVSRPQTNTAFKPELNNFKVILDNLSLSSFSLYKFTFSGNINVNGTLNNITNLQPDGTITLDRGEVTFFGTNFFIAPRYDSTLTFKPNLGVLNPAVDIKMQTQVPEIRQRNQLGSSETRQDLFRGRQAGNVIVTLSINGLADQIIPSLNKNISEYCQVDPDKDSLFGQPSYTQKNLDDYGRCLQANIYGLASDESLLQNPSVKFSSDPPRPQGEIISLLAGQFLTLADDLQRGNSDELIQIGLQQFILGPLQRDALYGFDQTVTNIGKGIGLQDLRLYPLVETSYRINSSSSVRFNYDYFLNQGSVRYQLSF